MHIHKPKHTCACNIYITNDGSYFYIDQPPAYPNDKPPDYHDVFPQKPVSPPPADITPHNNTDNTHPVVHVTTTTTDNTTNLIPLTTNTTYTVTSTVVDPESIVSTQLSTSQFHHNDVDNNEVSSTTMKLFIEI